MNAALSIEDLRVTAPGGARLLRGVSLTVAPSVPLTILGETGSGKTLVAEAAMGTLAPELSATGRIAMAGQGCQRPFLPGQAAAFLSAVCWG